MWYRVVDIIVTSLLFEFSPMMLVSFVVVATLSCSSYSLWGRKLLAPATSSRSHR